MRVSYCKISLASLLLASTAAAAPVVVAGTQYRTAAPLPAMHASAPRGELSTVLRDAQLGVPRVMWGEGRLVPGVSGDADLAARVAREFLRDQLGDIAPGASIGDFEIVSNHVDASGARSVGFVQHARGLRVVGGQVGFIFRRDRLAAVLARPYPNVQFSIGAARSNEDLMASATRWLQSAGLRVSARGDKLGERFVLPIVTASHGSKAQVEYRVVQVVDVHRLDGPGRWDVYVDEQTGEALMRRATIYFGTGSVRYHVPERFPAGTYVDAPASFATHVAGGTTLAASVSGQISFAGGTTTVSPGLDGMFVNVLNGAGSRATTSLSLNDGGVALWTAASSLIEAQLTAYIHANRAKEYARLFVPALPWLAGQIQVTVNEEGSCNAYSTGDDIHFLQAGSAGNISCENTGLLADVIYHEFGHSLHANVLIEGVGAFEGAVSEGMSDVYAALITGDPAMGRGFFGDSQELRHIDPAGSERVWPDDVVNEVHEDGLILAGAMWDLRKDLVARLGEAAGTAATQKIFLGVLQRSQDTLTSFAAALVADDDDGNMANGTPNLCNIRNAFALHGIADEAVGVGSFSAPTRDGLAVELISTTPSGACPLAGVTGVNVQWNLRGEASSNTLTLTATDLGAGQSAWRGAIPSQRAGSVVEYSVVVQLDDGKTASFPDNRWEPKYEMYVGTLEPLYCQGFESPPADWTLSGDFHQGAALASPGEPSAAFAGTGLLGTAIGATYTAEATSTAQLPNVDTTGFEEVRLQFRRWLTAEDGTYDRAAISINGNALWQNPAGNESEHFLDKEWVFKDYDLSVSAGQPVSVAFSLTADQALQFGGWSLDEVCIMGRRPGAAGVCGDGALDDGETCDDGNTTVGDGCSDECAAEGPTAEGESGGCCGAGANPRGLALLAAATLLMLRRRRRR